MRTSGWTPAATIPGPECLVLNLNSAAERILRAEDGLYHRHAVSPRRARIPAMNSVARCTVHGSTAPSVPSGHAFICKRPSGKRPYVVHVQPLSRAESDETFMGPTALVLIIDPEHQNEPATTVLRRLYRLTATETEVALRISRGKSLKCKSLMSCRCPTKQSVPICSMSSTRLTSTAKANSSASYSQTEHEVARQANALRT